MLWANNREAPLAEVKSTAYVDLGVVNFHTLVGVSS